MNDSEPMGAPSMPGSQPSTDPHDDLALPAGLPLPASERAPTNLEQRRALASVRARLFGEAPPVRVARYVIERRLGAGGMGEVYLAHDPELGRHVALKQVRAARTSPAERERLRREARALARLSHPNVVQVHEVGDDGGETYLAMEFVEGQTLREWLEPARPWPEIVEVFVAAGRGLSAAHSARVVHRDFKPDNVLIGEDGRPRVVDFGLALTPAALLGDEEGDSSAAPEIAGTIRYMSLEQLRGQAVDERSDQFSFCVAFYEALAGRSPFEARDVRARVAQLEADRPFLEPSPAIPRGLASALRRGMRRDPEARWPDLDALLDAVVAVGRRRQRVRWVLGGLSVAGLTLAGTLLAVGLPQPPSACAELERELAEVWGPSQAAELTEAFAALGAPHAPDSAARVDAEFRRWSTRWLGARSEQCEAAQARRDAAPVARARRACLERQRLAAGALSRELRQPELRTLDRSLEAVWSLPDPQRCSASALLEGPAPPRPEQRDEARALAAELELLALHRHLGQTRLPDTRAVHQRAAALGHGPLEAEALAELGRAELEAGSPKDGLERLDRAAKLALATNHRRLLAATWTSLASHRLSDYPGEDGGALLELAEAAWSELDPSPTTLARLAFARGLALDDDEGARRAFEEALALDAAASEQPGSTREITPAALTALASRSAGDEALALRRRALEAAKRTHGPAHPTTARYLFNLGAELRVQGHVDEAQPHLDEAVAIWTAAHDGYAVDLARAHLLLADARLRAGELDEAEAHARTLASIHARSLPPDHASHGDAPMLLARVYGLRGDRGQALAHAREALAAYARADGPGDARVLALRLDVAGNELGLGAYDSAAREYGAVLDDAPADAPGPAALAHIGLAEIELRRGELDGARAELRAVAELVQSSAQPTAQVSDQPSPWASLLGEQEVSYALLLALVDLRSGCRGCGPDHAERVGSAAQRHGWTLELLEPWLLELDLSPRERETLRLKP
ncbi:serine/threonine kinase family protein [Plesiocystis pacifica SIR-1]|uniref:non-specific serine/threonine protein kinase n=1 Tax=Plesiocystis pacifica SIR-1 TaxID=391625 RepID=A6FXG2_9BACT|nr:protein kinase [Plesiocystis pacifica]EDM81550.1 serine/threonine kinase family protein [Plesiocystis pacifica SIR-1]